MKKTIPTVASLLSFLIAPAPAFALFNVNQGGTGQSTFTSGALIYGNGTSPLAQTAAGTLGYVLQFNGTFPTWVSTSSLKLAAGSDGQIQFNNGGDLSSDPGLTWNAGVLRIGGPATSDTSTITSGGAAASPSRISSNQLIIVGDTLGFNDDPTNWYINSSGPGLYLSSPFASPVVSFGAQLSGKIVMFDISAIATSTEKVVKFPDFSGTFALLERDQIWTGTNTFSKGASATTTVNFGEMGDVTSHVCFNTKNTDGGDISFYFVGTSMVVENNACQ